jgi:hypothetical protein
MTTVSGRSLKLHEEAAETKAYLNSHQGGTNGERRLGNFDSIKSRSEIFSTSTESFDFLTEI